MLDKQAQSLMDVLLRLMPELKQLRRDRADPKLAAILYNKIWSNEQNRVAGKVFRRPDDVKVSEVEQLESDGLISFKGDRIEITEKGAHVVRQMILGDDRSIFEDDGKPANYLHALANLKPSRLKKSGKRASIETAPVGRNWYSLMRDRAGITLCYNCCRN